MKVIDMHCDTIGVIYEHRLKGEIVELEKNNLQLDIEKMKKSSYILQNFAMFIDIAKYKNPYHTLNEMINVFKDEINKNSTDIKQIFSYKDILENLEHNLISAMLTIEEGGALEGSLTNLEDVYKKGVRLITLTWNYYNGIGYPNYISRNKPNMFNSVNNKGGLTKFGIELLEAMNSLGVIVDVSHLSDEGFYDVLKYSTKPFVASHSNSRSITNVPRNLTDSMIKNLSNKGGITGINFCSNFITTNNNEKPAFTYYNDIIAHIKHIKNVGGIDCISLGSDFDGIPNTLEISDASKMVVLAEKLHSNGFTIEEIEKIFYKNVMRLYKEIL